jgi:hypothetical protein
MPSRTLVSLLLLCLLPWQLWSATLCHCPAERPPAHACHAGAQDAPADPDAGAGADTCVKACCHLLMLFEPAEVLPYHPPRHELATFRSSPFPSNRPPPLLRPPAVG